MVYMDCTLNCAFYSFTHIQTHICITMVVICHIRCWHIQKNYLCHCHRKQVLLLLPKMVKLYRQHNRIPTWWIIAKAKWKSTEYISLLAAVDWIILCYCNWTVILVEKKLKNSIWRAKLWVWLLLQEDDSQNSSSSCRRPAIKDKEEH